MWKRSFRARPPWKSESWSCENEAFVRDLPENLKVEAVKTKLSCETWDVPQNLKVEDVKTKLSCKTSLKKWKWKMWKRSFRARPPSNSDSWRCENVAFVRDLPENLKVEDVKTKLSCETSLKKWKWKMWKTKLSCETSLKIWKLKMWGRSFRARPPSKSESWRCENEVFVRDIPQKVKVEDVKAKLSCETSLKTWKWKMWQRSLAVRSLGCEISWLWDLLAVRSLGSKTSWLWDLLAVRSLGSKTSWLWDLLAVRSLGCEISWLWDLLAVRSLGSKTSWLWNLLAARSLGCEISWLWDLLAVRSLGCEISWLLELLAFKSMTSKNP